MTFKHLKYCWLFAVLLQSINSKANIILPSLISDNMVVQQNAAVHLWGKAAFGEKVSINILTQIITVLADEKGHWQTWLNPMPANVSVTMTVSGTNTILVKNILIGEVWLASGQSNMEWNVGQSNDSANEIKNANYKYFGNSYKSWSCKTCKNANSHCYKNGTVVP